MFWTLALLSLPALYILSLSDTGFLSSPVSQALVCHHHVNSNELIPQNPLRVTLSVVLQWPLLNRLSEWALMTALRHTSYLYMPVFMGWRTAPFIHCCFPIGFWVSRANGGHLTNIWINEWINNRFQEKFIFLSDYNPTCKIRATSFLLLLDNQETLSSI